MRASRIAVGLVAGAWARESAGLWSRLRRGSPDESINGHEGALEQKIESLHDRHGRTPREEVVYSYPYGYPPPPPPSSSVTETSSVTTSSKIGILTDFPDGCADHSSLEFISDIFDQFYDIFDISWPFFSFYDQC
ncbi:hypothetical protein GQ53DRAFT_829970 [Thozetella sp. PMI_491]|nr:hypothetical protein GQ53DRAFT_829970 [Thozetella sp. PMI_491]